MSASLVSILVLLVLGFIAVLLWRSFRPTLTNPMPHANNLETKMKVHAQMLITELSKILEPRLAVDRGHVSQHYLQGFHSMDAHIDLDHPRQEKCDFIEWVQRWIELSSKPRRSDPWYR